MLSTYRKLPLITLPDALCLNSDAVNPIEGINIPEDENDSLELNQLDYNEVLYAE